MSLPTPTKPNSLRISRVEGEYAFRLFLAYGKFPTVRIRKNGEEALVAITESWKAEEWARVLASFPLSEMATSAADQILALKVFSKPATRSVNSNPAPTSTTSTASTAPAPTRFPAAPAPDFRLGPLHDPLYNEEYKEYFND